MDPPSFTELASNITPHAIHVDETLTQISITGRHDTPLPALDNSRHGITTYSSTLDAELGQGRHDTALGNAKLGIAPFYFSSLNAAELGIAVCYFSSLVAEICQGSIASGIEHTTHAALGITSCDSSSVGAHSSSLDANLKWARAVDCIVCRTEPSPASCKDTVLRITMLTTLSVAALQA